MAAGEMNKCSNHKFRCVSYWAKLKGSKQSVQPVQINFDIALNH